MTEQNADYVRALVAVFLAATDDLPEDAEDGIRAVLAYQAEQNDRSERTDG